MVNLKDLQEGAERLLNDAMDHLDSLAGNVENVGDDFDRIRACIYQAMFLLNLSPNSYPDAAEIVKPKLELVNLIADIRHEEGMRFWGDIEPR